MPKQIITIIAVVLLAAYLLIRLPLVAHSQTTSFGRFSGTWPTHGGYVWIGPRGNGYYKLRTYVNCSSTVLTDCDKFKGSFIYPGGYGVFTLNRVASNIASGTITNSSTSWEIMTKVSFRLTNKDALVARGASDLLNRRRFCGPHAPVGYCGA